MSLQIEKIAKSKISEVDFSTLKFGQIFTDHMFECDFENGEWQTPIIRPYQPILFDPSLKVFHYGQAVFEGMKAYKDDNNDVWLFRPDQNQERLNISAERMDMPAFPKDLFFEGLLTLLKMDSEWVQKGEGNALYIRPFIFATEDRLSVSPSQQYTFCVILSPSGAYYAAGVDDGIRLLITTKFHRAVSGGTGASKASGNYAASLRAGKAAAEYGAAQVLYLDANNKQIEEVGAMNHFHILKDGTVNLTNQELLVEDIPVLDDIFGQ